MSSDDDLEIPNGEVETPPKAPKSSKSTSYHPKYNDMVVTAIKALDEKKGASVIAIKQWIIQRYPEIDQSRMKNLLRMALKRGVDSGAIIRPKKSESMAALTGRYKLGKPPKPVKKVVKKKEEKKKVSATGKKKVPKSPAGKKGRKLSEQDIFDYEDDTEGSDPDGGKTPPPYRKNRGKNQPANNRPRSASASATPKPRVSKSKAINRRSKSQSPAPSRLKKKSKKPASKSPVKKPASKSPAKKPSSKSLAKKPKAKPAASKGSPAATGKGKAKKPAAKSKEKTPTKKVVRPTKKKTVK